MSEQSTERPRLPPELEEKFEEIDAKNRAAYGEIEEMMEKLDTAARKLQRDSAAPIAPLSGTDTVVTKIEDVKRTIKQPPPEDDKDKP